MNGVNKVIIVGTLGRDPETKQTANGAFITNLNVATSETWTDKQNGQKQEKTEWHRVVIFGKLAEISGQYLKKGRQVYLEGKLQTRKWKDQSGQDRYSTEVVVDSNSGIMQMLGSGNDYAGNNIARNGNSSQSMKDLEDDDFMKPSKKSDGFFDDLDMEVPF